MNWYKAHKDQMDLHNFHHLFTDNLLLRVLDQEVFSNTFDLVDTKSNPLRYLFWADVVVIVEAANKQVSEFLFLFLRETCAILKLLCQPLVINSWRF